VCKRPKTDFLQGASISTSNYSNTSLPIVVKNNTKINKRHSTGMDAASAKKLSPSSDKKMDQLTLEHGNRNSLVCAEEEELHIAHPGEFFEHHKVLPPTPVPCASGWTLK
jgi:hypothetical protein